MKASDGHFDVAKFAGNPQGTRTLINEWVAYGFLQQLGVLTPALRIQHLSEGVRDSATDLYFSVGAEKQRVAAGFHLGSQCPVNPQKVAIYDALLHHLLRDFAKMFVADKLLGQADHRQAIFVHDRNAKGRATFQAHLAESLLSFREMPKRTIQVASDSEKRYRPPGIRVSAHVCLN